MCKRNVQLLIKYYNCRDRFILSLTWKSGNARKSQGGGGNFDEKVREIQEKLSKSGINEIVMYIS